MISSVGPNNNNNKNLHPWVKVDQAGRPLPPKTLSILVGLALKLISLRNHNYPAPSLEQKITSCLSED